MGQQLHTQQVGQPLLPFGYFPAAARREVGIGLDGVYDSNNVECTRQRQSVAESPERCQAMDDDSKELITTSIACRDRLGIARQGRPDRRHERTDAAHDIGADLDEERQQLLWVGLPLHFGHPRLPAQWVQRSVPEDHSVLHIGQEAGFGSKDEVDGLHCNPRRLGDHLHGGRFVAGRTEQAVGRLENASAGLCGLLAPACSCRKGLDIHSMEFTLVAPLV